LIFPSTAKRRRIWCFGKDIAQTLQLAFSGQASAIFIRMESNTMIGQFDRANRDEPMDRNLFMSGTMQDS
jgi:hypothetical protein